MTISIQMKPELQSLDPQNNPLYSQAIENGMLIKSYLNPYYEEGALTQNETVYIDFSNNQTCSLITSILTKIRAQADIDGVGWSQNQPDGVCDGECPDVPSKEGLSEERNNHTWFYTYDQNTNSTFHLPFVVGNQNYDRLTLSLNAT